MTTQNAGGKSGDLTLKQAGIMLVVIAAILVGAEKLTGSEWVWGGIPVIYVAGLFGVGGLILAVIGFVKKA